jgi:cobalt-zinc-cadmium efflux system membrane fusion protein
MGRFISGAMIAMAVAAAASLGTGCSQPSAPTGAAETASVAGEDAGLYCKEHGVPEKFCTLCHEELKESLLLCKEHGDIPEDICTLCHPEVEAKYDLAMCPEGHGLPEHFCSECAREPAA